MAATADQISEYKAFAQQTESELGIPKGLLVWQLQSESGYDPTASNPNSSAYGIAQFTKGTAAARGVNPADPYDSIVGAASYMLDLKKQTGSWMGALNAYGTTHDNPAKTAQAQSILNADNVAPSGQTLIYDSTKGMDVWYNDTPNNNTGSGAQGKQTNSTGTKNGSGGGSNFNNMLLIALFFVFGLALVILAFMNTDAGKKTLSFIATKGAA